MITFKCKMCGGDLHPEENATTCECEYCGSVQTIPTADNEKKMNLFGRAQRLLRDCEFDKAAGVYESIVAEFPAEAEAYWGLVLCKYGIEYIDDPTTGKKVPTCNRSSFDCVLEDGNFEQACENADSIARRIYRDEARAIEELRKRIIEVSGKEEPYDIFICYKETDEKGDRTLDSVLAQDIYNELTEKGYRVFFSRITLEDKLGQEYEPYIFAALNSAKVMLVVGTDYEYFNAVWVKNEWSRFLKLIAAGKKKTLIPCYKGIDAYDMPKEFTRLQAQDMGKVGAMQDLLHGIEKICVGANMRPSVATVQQKPEKNSIADFAKGLEDIGKPKEDDNKKKSLFSKLSNGNKKMKDDEIATQKAEYIKSFVVPNTKKDILELMILANTSIDLDVYSEAPDFLGQVERKKYDNRKIISDAWFSKMEQVYQKAMVTMSGDSDFSVVKEIYHNCIAEIKRKKRAKYGKTFLWVLLLVVLLGIGILYISKQ